MIMLQFMAKYLALEFMILIQKVLYFKKLNKKKLITLIKKQYLMRCAIYKKDKKNLLQANISQIKKKDPQLQVPER